MIRVIAFYKKQKVKIVVAKVQKRIAVINYIYIKILFFIFLKILKEAFRKKTSGRHK